MLPWGWKCQWGLNWLGGDGSTIDNWRDWLFNWKYMVVHDKRTKTQSNPTFSFYHCHLFMLLTCGRWWGFHQSEGEEQQFPYWGTSYLVESCHVINHQKGIKNRMDSHPFLWIITSLWWCHEGEVLPQYQSGGNEIVALLVLLHVLVVGSTFWGDLLPMDFVWVSMTRFDTAIWWLNKVILL